MREHDVRVLLRGAHAAEIIERGTPILAVAEIRQLRRREDRDLRLRSARRLDETAQDLPLARLVLGAADRDQETRPVPGSLGAVAGHEGNLS